MRYLGEKATVTVTEARVRLLAGTRTSLFTIMYRSVLPVTWPLFDTKYGITRVVKLPELEDDHAVPSVVDVNNMWNLSSPLTAFTPVAFHRDYFTTRD
jgi:hypothetical protein